MKSFVYLFVAMLIAVFYQNCSATHNENTALSAFQACNLVLKEEFNKGYRDFLKTNCSSCHVSGGSGNGAFADSNANRAFDAFVIRGNQLVGRRAQDRNHQSPFTGPQHRATIEELDQTWNATKVQADLCIANAGGTPDSGIENAIIPEDIMPTSGTVLTFVKLLEADKDIKTLEWDLGSEIATPGLNFNGAKLSIDVQAYTSSTGEKSYSFSNPVLTAGDQSLHISYIDFVVNDQVVESATSYRTINRRVGAGDTRFLGAGGTIFSYDIRATDVVALSIGRLEAITFNPPNFDELIDPITGVFGVNCLSCHSGNTPAGGFDISTRDSTLNSLNVSTNPNTSLVFIHMYNGTMPKDLGRLPEADIEQVLWWIQDGTP